MWRKFKRVSSIQPWTTNGTQLAATSEADPRHDFRLSTIIFSLECLESEGKNPANFYCTGSRVRFEERIHRTWNVLTGWSRHSIYNPAWSLPMWFTRNVPCIFAVWALMFKNWSYKNKLLPECSFYFLVSLCIELGNVWVTMRFMQSVHRVSRTDGLFVRVRI